MRIDGPSPLNVALLQVWNSGGAVQTYPTPSTQTSDAATSGAQTRGSSNGATAPVVTAPVAGQLRIEFDKASGIYVQTLTDPVTHEILRQFPHASQLEFARAARAYLDARLERW